MQIQPRLTEDERANLVAFLDGELEEDLTEKLEQKVAQSVSVRKEVQALEKTWALLDWLPRPELPEEFATETVTRIHDEQLRAERIEGRVRYWSGVVAKATAWAAMVLASMSLGFMALRYAWRDPSREFINELEIAENLELYRAVPDVKFLDDVARLGLFEDPNAPPPPPPPDSPGEPGAAPGGP